MLVVIEGVDGSGKSTLADELRYRLGPDTTTVLHRGQLDRHPLDEYELDLDDYRPQRGRHIICDRWHLGELIYGPLYRGVSCLTPEMLLHIEMYLRSRGALLVHLDKPTDIVQHRLRRRGETFLKPEDIDFVVRRYQQVIDRSSLLMTRSDDPFVIMNAAGHLENQVRHLAGYPSYIGAPKPRVLLLGEKRGRTARQSEGRHVAAFTPFPSTSGNYLMKAILTLLLKEQLRLGIANAYEENVRSLWETLDRPSVVALGRLASLECSHMDVPHRVVRHPQHVRRFAWTDVEVYAKEIIDGD